MVCVCVLATAVHRVAQVKITSLWLNIVSFCVYVCVCEREREGVCVSVSQWLQPRSARLFGWGWWTQVGLRKFRWCKVYSGGVEQI